MVTARSNIGVKMVVERATQAEQAKTIKETGIMNQKCRARSPKEWIHVTIKESRISLMVDAARER